MRAATKAGSDTVHMELAVGLRSVFIKECLGHQVNGSDSQLTRYGVTKEKLCTTCLAVHLTTREKSIYFAQV